MTKEIQVAVIAGAGVGKSLIAQIISEALAEKGFDTSFIEVEHPPRSAETVQTASAKMQERGTKISVYSMQARRDGTPLGSFPAVTHV